MADISKIRLPDNTVCNIKDSKSAGRKVEGVVFKNHDSTTVTAGAYAEQFNIYETDATSATYVNFATGEYSHAEGRGGFATGSASHTEGSTCESSGECSHAEGTSTVASAENAHSEGSGSMAVSKHTHAEGLATLAGNTTNPNLGKFSHAEGNSTVASANGSHAEGHGTIAASEYQHVQGKYNNSDANGTYAFIIGNGTGISGDSKERSNAMAIGWDGKLYPNNAATGIDLSTVNTNAAAGATAVQTIKINGTTQTKTNGVVNLPAYPTSLPASNTVSTYSSSGTAPINGTGVYAALQGLTATSKGGSGKYIQSISQSNGTISATPATLDTTISTSTAVAPTSKAVYDPVLENINNGVKNISQWSSGKATSANETIASKIPITADGDTYVIKYSSTLSSGTITVEIKNISGSSVVDNVVINNSGIKSAEVTIPSNAAYFNVISSVAGTYSDFMICKKKLWNISQTYQPYAPSNNSLYKPLKRVSDNMKNAFWPTFSSVTNHWGISIINNGNGTITLNGTVNHNSGTYGVNYILQEITPPEGYYILSCKQLNTIGYAIIGDNAGMDSARNNAVYFDGYTTMQIKLMLAHNFSASNLIVRPMLCRKEYYDLDIDYKSPSMTLGTITNAVSTIINTGNNKNYFVSQGGYTSVTGVTMTDNRDGSYKFVKSATSSSALTPYWKIYLEPGEYTISGCPRGYDASSFKLSMFNNSGSEISGSATISDYIPGEFTITSAGWYRVAVTLGASFTTTGITVQPMITRKAYWNATPTYVKSVSYIKPTPATNISIESGGYYRNGNTCIVNIRFRASAEIAANTTIFDGLPNPVSEYNNGGNTVSVVNCISDLTSGTKTFKLVTLLNGVSNGSIKTLETINASQMSLLSITYLCY